MRGSFLRSLSVAASIVAMAGAAEAACTTLPAGVQAVQPSDMLSRSPAGGGAMATDVRNLIASDPSKLSDLMGIARGANSDQRQAIGAGLGQAAGLCNRPEPATAQRIQAAVVELNNPELTAAFQTVTGDRRTTAVGGGAGGGGGGLGGGGIGLGVLPSGSGPSPYVPTTNSLTTNQPFTLSAGSGVLATDGATTRTVTSTVTVVTAVASRSQ